MPDFSQRSDKKELLDNDDIPFPDILLNMQELDGVNRFLGGHRITCEGVRNIISAAGAPGNKEWLICEIGCGNGNNLAALHRWCKRKNIAARFIGIDINSNCISAADPLKTGGKTTYIASDYKAVNFTRKPDIIFSSLFCHHFSDAQLTEQLQWLSKQARHGFFINDLHRHPLAYYSIKWLTSLFSRSYLVKNDAPLSVLRGFSKNEWKSLLKNSSIHNYSIKWRWAFRWLIVIVN
jgi:2-polyprenyl-3-methyl-5-hydroxy-6-metoxy-1,4-benzoquinol methylase